MQHLRALVADLEDVADLRALIRLAEVELEAAELPRAIVQPDIGTTDTAGQREEDIEVAVSVEVSTIDGTATTADTDYNVVSAQSVTFPAGATSQTVDVTINDDTTVEADDTLRIEHVADDGSVTVLKEAVPVEAGEVVDASVMEVAALAVF